MTLNEPRIRAHQLEKVYEGTRGLFPTSFEAHQGEFIAVVGHNGAGKSTLLKILGGWIIPDGGEASVDGVNLRDRTAFVRKVGFVPETPGLFDSFSVAYNLKLFARFFQVPVLRTDELLNAFNLTNDRNKSIQALSKGLKQRVSIARSLLPDPPVLLLDEPTSGLDFEMTRDIYKRLQAVHALGTTVLFTSHRPEEIKALATRILVLHEGRLVFDGLPDEYFRSNIHENLFS